MTKSKHETPRGEQIAKDNTILLTQVGSGLHGVTVEGHDDRDEMGICIPPKECVLGLEGFEQYQYRTQPEGHRSGPGDLDLVIYCHVPESLVLTANLEWRPIGSLSVGDRLVSFDEGPSVRDRHRHFATGTITAMQQRRASVVEVRTSEGITRVTPEHPFLVRKEGKITVGGQRTRTVWITAGELRPGDQIYSLPVWEEDRSWGGGYLAGQYDGEASLCLTTSGGCEVSSLSWAQKPGAEVFLVERLLSERGFKARAYATSNGCVNVHVAGGWSEQMRFLGSVRPRRLLRHARLSRLWEGRSLQACGRAIVESVTPVGVHDIIAMEVDSRTYIADGLLGHNSLQKWARLAAHGNPTVIMPLFAPDSEVVKIAWPGRDLRARSDLFISRDAGRRFLGYLNAQRERMLGLRSQRTNRPELVDVYGFDTKFAYHAIRLGVQGNELMTRGTITLPMPEPQRSWLRGIRTGSHTKDEVIEIVDELSEMLKVNTDNSDLPDKPNMTNLNSWLSDVHLAWWDR